MPEYSYEDRMVVEAEGAAWAALGCVQHVCEILSENEFRRSAKSVEQALSDLCKSLRDYNDQWETED